MLSSLSSPFSSSLPPFLLPSSSSIHTFPFIIPFPLNKHYIFTAEFPLYHFTPSFYLQKQLSSFAYIIPCHALFIMSTTYECIHTDYPVLLCMFAEISPSQCFCKLPSLRLTSMNILLSQLTRLVHLGLVHHFMRRKLFY